MSCCTSIFAILAILSHIIPLSSQQPDPDPSGDRKPPSIKKMPARKRKFTRKTDRRDKRGQQLPPEGDSNAPDSDESQSAPIETSAAAAAAASEDSQVTAPTAETFASVLRKKISSRGAKRKMSNAILNTNLKTSLNQLAASKSTLDDKDRQISTLSKKNKELADLVRNTRHSTRQTLATASAEVKQASLSAKAANSEMDALHETIEEKESALLKQKQQLDSEMMSSIAAAVEKEKVSTFPFLFACQHCPTPIKHP